MNIIAVKTPKITPNDTSIFAVLDTALPELVDGSIVAVTSKIVSICEGNLVPIDSMDKDELLRYYKGAEMENI